MMTKPQSTGNTYIRLIAVSSCEWLPLELFAKHILASVLCECSSSLLGG
jgi:hypothetical protein